MVADARPVARDLRPFVADLNDALRDTLPITRTLKRSTGLLTSYLNDTAAFVFNTSSVFGIKDGQSGYIRAYATEPLPDFGSMSGQHGPVSSRRPGGHDPGKVHHPNNTMPTIPGLGGRLGGN
jgi:hypothetical protein